MSVGSWKHEFYKGRIRDAAKTALGAAEHSLRKWKGLKPKNLAKHGVIIDGYGRVTTSCGDTTFEVNANTCALCVRARDEWNELVCDTCPYKMANGYDCGTNYESGWHKWCDDHTPKKMIKELKKTIKFIKKNQV